MPFDLQNFRKLTALFDPIFQGKKSQADGRGAYYVAEAHETFRNEFVAALSVAPSTKLLIAGQPGCGKTTLLQSIASELRGQGRLVAFVDMELLSAIQELGHVEMHLAALAEVLRESQQSGYTLSREVLDRCRGWLDALAEADDGPATPDGVARRMMTFLSALRDSSELRRELRRQVQGEQDPFSLVSMVLSELGSIGADPLVILDGLDKLPPEQARDFFLVEKRKPMVDAPGATILTIPLSMVYEPTFKVLSEPYRNPGDVVLPAIRLHDWEPDKRQYSRNPAGFSVMYKVIRSRVDDVDPDIFVADAIELAIESSGGNLRELARAMQNSIVKAVVEKASQVGRQHVEAAIADQREAYRRLYSERFRSVLDKVASDHELPGTEGDLAKQLLYGLWVVEYRNGRIWYDIPLPVKRLLGQAPRDPRISG